MLVRGLVGLIGLFAGASIIALVLISPSVAKPAAIPSFSDVEYKSSSSEALSADQQLAEAIAPKGIAMLDAIAAVRKAGGRYAKRSSVDNARLTFATTEVLENVQHDVVVTVTLKGQGGFVNSVAVERASYGS